MKKDETIKKIIPIKPSTIETIDFAMYNWLEDLNLHCQTNEGWKKVRVQWVIGERSRIGKRKDARDEHGALILPIITLERTSVTKDPTRKGKYWGNIPPVRDAYGGSITVARRINQEKTSNSNRSVAKKKFGQLNYKMKDEALRPVYEYMSIPMPIYVEMSYSISVRTNYQQQINELTQPFMTTTGGINAFILNNEGHSYEAFIQSDFSQDNNVSSMAEEERTFKTSIEIKVLGKLIGDGLNQEKPHTVIRESIVKVDTREEIID